MNCLKDVVIKILDGVFLIIFVKKTWTIKDFYDKNTACATLCSKFPDA